MHPDMLSKVESPPKDFGHVLGDFVKAAEEVYKAGEEVGLTEDQVMKILQANLPTS